MSKNKEKKLKKQDKMTGKLVESPAEAKQTVKMKFSEHKYYDDLTNPIFQAGETYEMVGAAWIQRWLKRGGMIVEGTLELPPQDPPNPSVLVGQNPPPLVAAVEPVKDDAADEQQEEVVEEEAEEVQSSEGEDLF